MDINRVIQDIEEGIIIVDNDGTISNFNPKAKFLLSIEKDYTNKKYVEFIDDTNGNDAFHQMLIDVIDDKKIVHKKRIKYNIKNEQKIIYITSSILKDEYDNQVGVILSFDDVTIEEELKKKNNDSALTFIILVVMLSLWIFACAIYINDTNAIDARLFGRFIMYLPLALTPIATNVFGFTLEDLGLKTKGIKKYIINDIIFTILSLIIMCVIKLFILRFVPSFTFLNTNNLFFDFTKSSILIKLEYGICVIAQEFLSRGLVYESVRRIVQTEKNEKYVDAIAIIVSSLYFAALHIHLGPIYMFGAFVLLSLFGIIYKKQRSIWGLCIPHYVLGLMLSVLGFTLH